MKHLPCLFILITFCMLFHITGCSLEEDVNAALTSSDNTIRTVYDGSNDQIGVTQYEESSATIELTFNPEFESITLLANGLIAFDPNISIEFEEENCSGSLYVKFNGNNGKTDESFNFQPPIGQVFEYEKHFFFYSPLNPTVHTNKTMKSYYISGVCDNYTSPDSTDVLYIALKPNDFYITGIKSYPFNLPITVEGLNPVDIL